ncbi:hypothetical protein AGOR_G00058370 [Albula goreensis]|uniref:Non-homologous end-joining factor 1 n=1 Tax=Albula goreensis TaxID=1534307 RepID=A0A8T3DS63_9TELE|nr:hypothetical protein AGOR_G00058370 [Albula goreensis]
MASAGVSEALLLEQSWAPVCLGGLQLLAKSCFKDTAYRLLLSDMQFVWEEEVNTAAIQERAQELNRRLRAPVSAFFTHLCKVACPRLTGCGEDEDSADSAEFSSLQCSQDRLDIRLKSELAGVPFYWEFRCTPASVAVVCSHFVRPLLAVSMVLQRQVGELGTLLARKDTEIQDYKESGAELSRARLKTEVFDEQSYRETFITQVLPQVCAAQDGLGFDADLQELYTAVTAQSSSRKRKRSDSHDPGERGPDRSPKNHSVPESQPLGESLRCSAAPGVDLGAALGPKESSSARPEPGTRQVEFESIQSQQTAPPSTAPSDRPSSRPRKKKAVGLFR